MISVRAAARGKKNPGQPGIGELCPGMPAWRFAVDGFIVAAQ
ncbi:hypothetical protein [Faecalibaculum rodentium]|nr:hypothetical protein [Faecalibaculum rodentium]